MEEQKDDKDFSYHTVKTSLSGRLKDPKLKPIIESMVDDSSKAIHRASILFNRLLIHYLENNIPLPDLKEDQNLFINIINICQDRLVTYDNILSEIYTNHFSQIPIEKKPKHICQVYCYLAIKYRTNFFNMLVYPFMGRLKHRVNHWCYNNDIPKDHCRIIVAKINGWTIRNNIPLSNIEEDFIKREREMLGNPDWISENWLSKNYKTVLKYYYYILPTQPRKFTLAPICKIKRHFITIDNTTFKFLVRERKPIGKDRPSIKEWNEVFEFKNIRKNMIFTNNISTDGVSISFLFKKKKTNTIKKELVINPEKVIGLDPGRCNIAFCTDGERSFRLTRKTYYKRSGMTRRKKKANHYEKNINYNGLNEISLKTLDPVVFTDYINRYSFIFDHIWEEKLRKKRSRDDFRVYCLKNKLLDGFFSQFKDSTIAYGNAKFNSHGFRGEMSVPTTFMYKKCIQHCNTQLVNEYNTTKMCNGCGAGTQNVKYKNSSIGVRGLRWCKTNCHRLLDRDLNAALNIRSCLTVGRHPNLSGEARLVIDGSHYIASV